MDIRAADVHRLRLPMNGTYEIAGSATESMETVLVVLEDATGERGIGTADPVPGHPIPQTIDEIYAGLADGPLDAVLDAAPSTPNELLRTFGTVPGQLNGKCALELAFLDLYCRRRDQSLAEYLGGALSDAEPLNAWVGIEDPDSMAEEARTWRDRGFGSLKMKIAGDREVDVARVRAVCAAVGDSMAIRVDANEGYADVDEAVALARDLEAFDLAHLEQPIPREDLDGLARVADATSLTVMADEPILTPADGYRALKADAAGRLKFKILKSGGVTAVRRGLDVAAAAGVSCVVGHGFCTTPAASAELQLVASHENVFRPAETVGTLKMREEPFDAQIAIEDGTATVPDGPGLGVRLDDERLPEFVVETAELA